MDKWINTEDDVIKWAKKNNINPKDIYNYAYDIYRVMSNTGIEDDSIGREAIFSWATKQLSKYGITYDDIYNAWLSRVPVPPDKSKIDIYEAGYKKEITENLNEIFTYYKDMISKYGNCKEVFDKWDLGSCQRYENDGLIDFEVGRIGATIRIATTIQLSNGEVILCDCFDIWDMESNKLLYTSGTINELLENNIIENDEKLIELAKEIGIYEHRDQEEEEESI